MTLSAKSSIHFPRRRLRGSSRPFPRSLLFIRIENGHQRFFEAVNVFQLRGWAADKENFARHIQVLAEVDGQVVGRMIASAFRQDLALAGIGSGDHGFVMNLDPPLQESELGKVKVFGLDEAERVELLIPAAPREAAKSSRARDLILPALQLPFEPVDTKQFPVFVLGAARSGTSALTHGLLRSGWYEGENEGHLLTLLPQLLRTTNTFYENNAAEWQAERATLIAKVPKAHFLASLRSIFAQLPPQFYPTGRWVDKTPTLEMVVAAPILKEIWPNAQFIFAYRRGLENVASRIRKFPQVSFAEHCQDWANIMSSWTRVGPQLGAAAIEIEQRDLVLNPAGVASRLSDALGIPADHRPGLTQSLSFDRPERTSTDFGGVYDLAGIHWPDEAKREFASICGPMMTHFGYTTDSRYRVSATLVSG